MNSARLGYVFDLLGNHKLRGPSLVFEGGSMTPS
ncbi:MAG: hypothetical protein ACJARC_000177 [Sulfitobacter sp.]|jgi:hypothetical protein